MNSNNKVQLLISTMNQKDEKFLEKINLCSDAVVINQCMKSKIYELTMGSNSVLWIDSEDVGLSKSRNMALDNSSGKYLVISDDDLEYIDGYEKIIESAFERISKADIIAFQVEGIEREFKKYGKKEKNISFWGSLHISSVEIVIRKQSIDKKNVRFAEEFGSGAKYRMGEENIFLFDCLKKGMKIFYVPQVIAKLHMEESTWFNGFTEKYFYDRGAVSRKLYGDVWGIFMIYIFAVKNYYKYRKELGFIRGIRNMLHGYKEYSDVINNTHSGE